MDAQNDNLHYVQNNVNSLKYKQVIDTCLTQNIQYFDANFWHTFIGYNKIELDYLQEIFSIFHHKFNTRNEYLLLFKSQELVGIVVYSKLPFNSFKIMLVAKNKNCTHKGVGQLLFDFLEKHLICGTFLLVDDSGIPDYYHKLGFSKSYGPVNYIFGEYDSPSYYKTFGENELYLCCC